MFKLAWRNLIHDPVRIIISVGGVALAILLIVLMEGIFAGAEEHAVIYIRNQPATLWLMQSGVENMHMSSSILPAGTVERVRGVPGVQNAIGVLYANAGIEIGDDVIFSYIFGVAPDAPFGGPWSLVAGSPNPAVNEIVLDHIIAERYGLDIGDSVEIMGYDLEIAGLTEDTFGMATSITFANKTAMALLMGVSPDAASYVLIQPQADVDTASLKTAIQAAVPEANTLTQDAFAISDREMIRQMGADVIRLMNIIAYVIGMLVIGITIYLSTVELSREYGVLKAIGASPHQLLRLVLSQSFIAAVGGYVVGIAFAYIVASFITGLVPEMPILLEPIRWMTQFPMLLVVAVLATLFPISRIIRIDPLLVFKA